MEARILNPQETVEGETIIMPFSKKVYTIADIEALPEGERAELINGEMFMLASPNAVHQELLGTLYVAIYSYIKGNRGKCKVYVAPYSVYLHNDDKTYLEPDIAVICSKDKMDIKGCHGAPDWVIEITSPSTRARDYGIKLEEYRKAGVVEYWIVDPGKGQVTVHHLQAGTISRTYSFTEKVPVGIYNGFEIDFQEITEGLADYQ